MPKYAITKTYKVKLPEIGTLERSRLHMNWWEEEGQLEVAEGRLDGMTMTQEEYDEFVETALAYYVLEKSHVGDYTDWVEEVDDSIEEAP